MRSTVIQWYETWLYRRLYFLNMYTVVYFDIKSDVIWIVNFLWFGPPGIWTISKPEVSAPISCWVTSDPAESPILPGQNMLCTYASEYNP